MDLQKLGLSSKSKAMVAGLVKGVNIDCPRKRYDVCALHRAIAYIDYALSVFLEL